MKRNVPKSRYRPWLWGASIVAVSALVGVWNANDPTPVPQPDPVPNGPTTIEKIESTLAQAGCPGWMVLATEGESALQPLPPIVDEAVEQTALRVEADVPTVNYPKPIRVANRVQFSPPSGTAAKLTTSPTEDPDDLLDGVPDLLAAPEETPEPASEDDTPTDAEEAPAPTEEATPEQESVGESDQEPTAVPAAEPESLPVVTEEEPTSEEGPTFPGPTTPIQESPEESPREELPRQPPQPIVTPPTETNQPLNDAFAPPARPQPRQPENIAPLQPRQPEKIAPPQPTQQQPTTPPAQPRPVQSPFAPPPQPANSAPHSVDASDDKSEKKADEPQSYCEYVAEQQYPSAHVCAKCHKKIFDEWSISSHAYAGISPMFHKFEQTINDLSQGTVGYFCYRCHVPVGTTMGLSRATPLWDLPQVAREGVTCIACHRVNQRYGKVNGHRRIEPGSIYDPVYGSIGGGGIAEVISQKNKYKVKTSPHEKGPGQAIHTMGQNFDQLGKSEFCVSCHQVAVHPGIKLEVVWEQYRASPACKKGVSCQDCHMGRIPGVKSGYEYGAAAVVNDKVVNKNRKHANHIFYGPGYSIAHPGVFPHNADALQWSMKDWLQFDWRAGWGTDEFEKLVEEGRIHVRFPKVWAEADDRYDARDIIDDNQKRLDYKRISRQQTMENGSHVDGPFFDSQLMRGQDLKFHYIMTNTNEGHNLPSGSLGAQPQLWANVVLIGPRGQRLWESGYTDRYGDVADIHSEDVRNKLIPFDWQLFNLQTMFLITGAKGTDREFFLPVNIDFDQLPYLRPGAQPISVLNHPPFIRMEGRSLAPLGSRKIPYKVPAELMCEPGHYRLSFRLRSRAEPIYFMRFCGSTEEMNRAMNEGMIDFHQSSVEFVVR